FLNHTAPTGQDYGYCVFGKVASGTEVLDAIRKTKTGSRSGHDDVPLEDIVLIKAEVVQ
ncbi:MAG: peptidylprolyl isomerase, partial [Candidatus Nitrotoga sp.]|nr:peptidylprolyl isomerase [Candidatus Nitrotoga sp.]